MPDDLWDPNRYGRFGDERAAPFADLLAGLAPAPGARLLDLGCGTAALTAEAHRRLGVRRSVGVDRSARMLARAEPVRGLALVRADLARLPLRGAFEVVLSNAALHWVEDHPALLRRLLGHVTRGGQLGVQVPGNHRHPSQLAAVAVCGEEPFATALGGWERISPVLEPDEYLSCLRALGCVELRAEERVYEHPLAGPEAVLEWLAGTTLTDTRKRLPAELWEPYLERLGERLTAELPSARPYLLQFRRIFFWARRP